MNVATLSVCMLLQRFVPLLLPGTLIPVNVLGNLEAILSQETRIYTTQHATAAQEAGQAALGLADGAADMMIAAAGQGSGDSRLLNSHGISLTAQQQQQYSSQLAGQANGLSSLLANNGRLQLDAISNHSVQMDAQATSIESQSVIANNQAKQYISMPTFF